MATSIPEAGSRSQLRGHEGRLPGNDDDGGGGSFQAASRNARLLLYEVAVPFFADNQAIRLAKLPKDSALFMVGQSASLEGGIAATQIIPGETPSIATHVPVPGGASMVTDAS